MAYLKKMLVFLIISSLLLSGFAYADTKAIDLTSMTVEELEELIEEIENEKRTATEVTSKIREQLETDFMKTVEALFPEGTKFSYPFFGLSVVHRRNYYCVCGTVGCKLPDKSKQNLWDATIIYWHDENANAFYQAAFYTKDDVYFVDETALKQVERNLEPIVRENLKKHNITIRISDEKTIVESAEAAAFTPAPLPTATINPRVLLFENLAPGATILNLQEVLSSIPSDLHPSNYDSTYIYYFNLKDAMEKGVLSESQTATLANYMSKLVRSFEENCIAFKRKYGRSGRDALVISLSAGLAFRVRTSASLNKPYYGIVSVDHESLIHIEWNDGSENYYYIGKDNSEQKKLLTYSKTDTSYTEVDTKEVDMSYQLGSVNYYLQKTNH